MASNRKLSPTEVRPIFEGKDRRRNTRYYHTMATNPDTPPENMEMVDQFRMDHPEMFLTNEEIEADPYIFKPKMKRRGYRGGYRTADNGETYDPEGNMVGGWNDGGYPRQYRDPYRPSDYHMTNAQLSGGGVGRPRRRENPRDPSKPLSDIEIDETMKGLQTPYRRTKFFQKVRDNPQSNIDTVDRMILYKDSNPDMFMTDEQVRQYEADRPKRQNGYGNGYNTGYRSYSNGYGNRGYVQMPRDYDRQSWDQNWQSKDQFDAMPQEKRSLFSKFIRSRDRNRNSKLALKILSDPNSTQENVQYTKEIVRDHPDIFWRPKR
ncbi:MAG: hypothetical protein IJT54_02220 [Candidatus Methanomethylophilaceae archaeon]|nr:hypothetical protein [Candidatus Methanomethylophilaceae archaeon]